MRHLNSKEFKKAIESEKLVVVDFYADWCMPCRYISPVLEKLEKEYDGQAEFYKLNVDENQDVAIEFGIASIPTVLFFRNGKVVGGFIGAMPESAVRSEIDKALRA
ncbi:MULTISPECIES: thioredoxin [unclassified Archaeoglobus]|jgi:thioredoxin 1|uniref:thioredoxin n=1 Tax=unclassified Archaeoglobus TaxID=2643606 RepID=UPI0025BE322A|nr:MULTISPECIES: thioredoxin [unclassified Archaeoglobus]